MVTRDTDMEIITMTRVELMEKETICMMLDIDMLLVKIFIEKIIQSFENLKF